MPAHSAGVAIFLLFSRSLILQKYLFEQSKFYRRNQTHEEPDRELRVSGQIALQNRLIDSVVQSAEPHIQMQRIYWTMIETSESFKDSPKQVFVIVKVR